MPPCCAKANACVLTSEPSTMATTGERAEIDGRHNVNWENMGFPP
jgi:hypothetical protein